jgi:hypothetical protein
MAALQLQTLEKYVIRADAILSQSRGAVFLLVVQIFCCCPENPETSSGLYYKYFTIVIYNHNDSGLYYKTTILAKLALARIINYGCRYDQCL